MNDPRKEPGFKTKLHVVKVEALLGAILDALLALQPKEPEAPVQPEKRGPGRPRKDEQ